VSADDGGPDDGPHTRIQVDRDRCVGAGMCTLNAPEVFDQDRVDGLVLLLRTRVPHPAEAVHDAADLCPSGAIVLE
jgi:ferredoxin